MDDMDFIRKNKRIVQDGFGSGHVNMHDTRGELSRAIKGGGDIDNALKKKRNPLFD